MRNFEHLRSTFEVVHEIDAGIVGNNDPIRIRLPRYRCNKAKWICHRNRRHVSVCADSAQAITEVANEEIAMPIERQGARLSKAGRRKRAVGDLTRGCTGKRSYDAIFYNANTAVSSICNIDRAVCADGDARRKVEPRGPRSAITIAAVDSKPVAFERASARNRPNLSARAHRSNSLTVVIGNVNRAVLRNCYTVREKERRLHRRSIGDSRSATACNCDETLFCTRRTGRHEHRGCGKCETSSVGPDGSAGAHRLWLRQRAGNVQLRRGIELPSRCRGG